MDDQSLKRFRLFKLGVSVLFAPIVGFYVAAAVFVFIGLPVSLMLEGEPLPEQAVSSLFLTHIAVIAFGSITAAVFGIPVSLMAGVPFYFIQKRLNLLGPASFACTGVILGTISAIWYSHYNAKVPIFAPTGQGMDSLILLSATLGWLWFWCTMAASKLKDELSDNITKVCELYDKNSERFRDRFLDG